MANENTAYKLRANLTLSPLQMNVSIFDSFHFPLELLNAVLHF